MFVCAYDVVDSATDAAVEAGEIGRGEAGGFDEAFEFEDEFVFGGEVGEAERRESEGVNGGVKAGTR